MFESIDLRSNDLIVKLDEQDTLWYYLSCKRCSSPFGFVNTKNKIKYMVYLFSLVILQSLTITMSNIYLVLTATTTQVIILLFVLFDCNLFVFKRALLAFQVYYKTINICIASVSIFIDYRFFEDGYSCNYNNCVTLSYTIGILSIFKSSLAMFVICISDGYKLNTYLKVLIILFALITYIYSYFSVLYFSKKGSFQVIGHIFNHPFHWHTLAVSTMSSAIIFLIVQCFFIIRYPNKLILIPTFIPFNDKNSAIYINVDKKQTILYKLLYSISINEDRILKICKYAHHTKLIYFCLLYVCIYITLLSMTNYHLAGNVLISIQIINNIAILIGTLAFNWVVTKHILKTFTFWWKIQDALNFVAAYYVVDYANKANVWSLNYATITQLYIWAIFTCIGVIQTVFGVASVKALIKLPVVVKCAIILSTLWFLQVVIIRFFNNDEYYIIISEKNNIILSCRTVIIEKGFDICIFFMWQMYSHIIYGMDGIQFTGYVEIQFPNRNYNYNKFRFERKLTDNNDESTDEMNEHLLTVEILPLQ